MAVAVTEMFICSNIAPRYSEMEVRPFIRIQKVIWNQLLASKAWFRYDRPDRPSRLKKKCSDDRDGHMETLPRRSQTTRTTETTSIAWIELSSIRTIGAIV